MSPRARALIGVVTALFFGVSGALLIAEQQTTLGAVLVGLGLLRGVLAIQQARYAMADDDE